MITLYFYSQLWNSSIKRRVIKKVLIEAIECAIRAPRRNIADFWLYRFFFVQINSSKRFSFFFKILGIRHIELFSAFLRIFFHLSRVNCTRPLDKQFVWVVFWFLHDFLKSGNSLNTTCTFVFFILPFASFNKLRIFEGFGNREPTIFFTFSGIYFGGLASSKVYLFSRSILHVYFPVAEFFPKDKFNTTCRISSLHFMHKTQN